MHILIRPTGDATVNADHHAVKIKQRSARITAQQHAIGAQRVFGGADDTAHAHYCSAVFIQAARVAYSNTPLADPGKFLLTFIVLDHRQVFRRIGNLH